MSNPRTIALGRGSYCTELPEVIAWADRSRITVGNYASIAKGVRFVIDAEHDPGRVTTSPRHGIDIPGTKGDIRIGNDVWVGAYATILSGVTVGDGAVVGAAAVVAKDVPPYAVVVGNPARVVRSRFDEDTVAGLRAIRWWDWPDDQIRAAADLLWSDRVAEFVARYRPGAGPHPDPLATAGREPRPGISVVMPVYNGARFLDRAVGSLGRQTFRAWELLAVDDASADASAARLENLAASDPRVRVFRHPANRGPAAARNTALRAARGDLVAYLDCDDEFAPGHLARAWADRDRADVFLFRYDLIEERPDAPGYGRVTTHDPAARRDFLFAETIAVPLGVVHRRELVDRVGGFDERLWRDEDGDLWRRFARAGARFAAVGEVSGRYHVRPDSLARVGPPGPG